MKSLYARGPAVLLLAILIFPAFAYAQGSGPVKTMSEFRVAMQNDFNKWCEDQRGRLEKAKTDLGREYAQEGIQMYCTCLPAETERLSANVSDSASKDEMWGVFDQATRICGGREVRAGIAAKCTSDPATVAKFPDAAARNAYCGCVTTALSNIDDVQIHTQVNDAHRDALIQANTKREKHPLTVYPAAIAHFGARCEAVPITTAK